MQILLLVRAGPSAPTAAQIELAVEIDGDASVADLVDAVVAECRRSGITDIGRRVFSTTGEPLDPAADVVLSGVTSGHTLWLTDDAPPRRARVACRVEAVAGADPHARALLLPGRHSIGSDVDHDVALLSAARVEVPLAVDVAGDGSMVVDGGHPDARLDASTLVVGHASFAVRVVHADHAVVDASGSVPFNRVPAGRLAVEARQAQELEAPPATAATNRLALASLVLPVVSGVGFAVISGRPQFLLIALLAPVALAAVMLLDRRLGRRSARRSAASWLETVDARAVDLRRLLEDERVERHRIAPHVDELCRDAAFGDQRLWSRSRVDPLQVRLGTGDDRARVAYSIAGGGDDELRAKARERLAFATSVTGVPSTIDLASESCVAIVGDRDSVSGLARSVVGQLAGLHAPDDLVIAAALPVERLHEHRHLRWLPHIRSSATPIAADHLAVWPDAVSRLLDELTAVALARDDAGDSIGPRVVVVIDEAAPIDRSVLGRLLDAGASSGVHVLWIGTDPALVPRQADAIVRVAGDHGAVVERGGGDRQSLSVETLGLADAEQLARDLAPLRDVAARVAQRSLPNVVGLAEVPGVPATVDALLDAWAASDGGHLCAPIGLADDGPMVVDLVDDGPHALVAGTTGAGKSELLQSWVASLAAHHPPERLSFLFVDYKGGAATDVFAGLAHTVGSVTNLEPRMAHRAIVSLEAELDRRMALLEGRAKDITEFARSHPEECPPRLVIVIDEFAELVDAIPEFVDGIVEIARIGRSLGVHVVLATQRPSGSVSNNILSNTNLRIALRVVSVGDSTDILGVPDAASLPPHRRGRAMLRVGTAAVRAFQAAWAAKPVASGRRAVATAAPLDTAASTWTGTAADQIGATGDQLRAVLGLVDAAHRESGGRLAPRPWVPPLPDVIGLSTLWPDEVRPTTLPASDAEVTWEHPGLERDPGRVIRMGVRDEPRAQRAHVWSVDLEESGGLVVAGGPGSGRSTALRTAVVSAIADATPFEVEVVVFDFASRTLLALDALPHTRAVVTGDELERAALAIEMLSDEISRRRVALADAKVDRLSSLRNQAGGPVWPRVLVVVDGFGDLHEALDRPDGYRWNRRLEKLAVDGRAVGVHLLASAGRRSDIPASVLGGIRTKLVLSMPDVDDMAGFGIALAAARGATLPPGRALLGDGTEVQVAVLGRDPDTAAQSTEVGRVASLIDAAPAPVLPSLDSAPAQLPPPVRRLVVPIGFVDVTLDVAAFDLDGGHLTVIGSPGSGRSTVLDAVAASLHDPIHGTPDLVAIGGSRSPLLERSWHRQAFVRSGHLTVAEASLAELPADVDEVRMVVFVDASDDVDDLSTGRVLEQLASHPAVRFVVATDPSTASRAFGGWLGAVRRGRRTLLLGSHSGQDIEQLTGVRLALRPETTWPVGRAVLASDGRAAVVQTITGKA